MIKQRLLMAGASALIALAGSLAYYFEGEVKSVYLDPVGIPTACIGHTGPELVLGQIMTTKQCTDTFIADLKTAEAAVNRCTPKVPEAMKQALISFVFNVGEGAYCKSTLAKKANAAQFRAACGELLRWTRAGGKVLPGLVKRRNAEYASCVGGL